MDARSAQRVLIVRPSALGDVARTVGALVALRRAMPEAQIDWLVHDAFGDAVAHHPALNHVVGFPRQRFGAMWRSGRIAAEAWRWARQLRCQKYDLVIDLQGLFRSGLMTWLTRAPQRVGYANAREMAHLAYTRRHRVSAEMHTVDRTLALLRAEGYDPGDKPAEDLRLYVGKQDQEWLEGIVRQPYVTIAPTAQWLCKCWPIDCFIEVAQRLGRDDRVVVLAAPDERDYVAPLVDALGDAAVCPHTTVGQMMALISRTKLLVCNDSAPLHVAVGFARPIVTIFGPTDPALVGPYGRGDTVVQPPNTDRQAMRHYRRHRDDQSLIAQVTVDMVWAKIREQFG